MSSNALAAESSETPAVGPRVDLLAAGYMPFDDGATWTYAVLDTAGAQTGTAVVTLSNTAGSGGARALRFTRKEGSTTETSDYRWASDGLYASLDGLGAPAGAAALIGSLREYAFPNYAEGETRTVVRAGTWDLDVDGDGRFESFRLEYTQRLEGTVTLALPWDGAATAVRLSATLKLVIQPSSSGSRPVGVRSTRDEFFVSGVGMVKSSERIENLDGVLQGTPSAYRIVSAEVAGRRYAAPSSASSSIIVDLPHAALVHDGVRNLYYAAVTDAATTGARTIATIVPATGAVSYSATLPAPADALAISADASVLYVGLGAIGQVAKLSLPSLSEVARITVGSDPFFGTMRAESLSVSPVDRDVLAMSRAYSGVTPRHAGVALVSGTTILPVTTQTHTGSNLISFGADGSVLFGLNNETTEFGLRRIAAAADGLREGTVVRSDSGTGVGRLVFSNGLLYLGPKGWRATDLTLSGAFDLQSSLCIPLASTLRAVCAPGPTAGDTITVWGTSAFNRLATLALPPLAGQSVRDLVPGRAGTLAVSAASLGSGMRIFLLSDPSF